MTNQNFITNFTPDIKSQKGKPRGLPFPFPTNQNQLTPLYPHPSLSPMRGQSRARIFRGCHPAHRLRRKRAEWRSNQIRDPRGWRCI